MDFLQFQVTDSQLKTDKPQNLSQPSQSYDRQREQKRKSPSSEGNGNLPAVGEDVQLALEMVHGTAAVMFVK